MPVKVRILLIEHNLFIGGILIEKLKALGHDVEMVSDGQEGLHRMLSGQYHIVVLDLDASETRLYFTVLSSLQDKKDLPVPRLLVMADAEEQPEIQEMAKSYPKTFLVKAYSSIDEIVVEITKLIESKDIPLVVSPAPMKKGKEGLKPGDPEAKVPLISAQKKLRAEIEKLIVLPNEELAIVGLVDNLVEYAYWARASDIHIKPEENRVLVRLRIDGNLHDSFVFPKNIHQEVITRIKVLSGMRTDEHQAAQDGRFKTDIKTIRQKFDIRVSVVPTYYGEDAVLRLLVEQVQIKSIDDLPMSENDLKRLNRAVTKPFGMILATGPTGSGKTTTLYTVLRDLNKPEISIITIEDPIEYSISGINQIQVNSRTGLTFADGLRSILRQDPDIIMVGEIRDKETAGIAVNAALTGHLLLSTLHTNDAATTLPRLLDMGVEPFLIASTVNVAIGQRLVRQLCKTCKKKYKITQQEYNSIADLVSTENATKYLKSRILYKSPGCDKCGNSGYSGRTAIYEILEVDDEIRKSILNRGGASEIKKIALKNGMTTMVEDGLRKAVLGETSIEEVLRVVRD